ncbi:hypothetical protein Tco_0445984 [Tanacetum coccineum]
MDVRRIEEEVDPDFLSDAHSRTGPAECWRFVGKRTNVNARSRRSTKVDESKLCDIPVVCRSGVKRKLFESCRNNMGNEPILALPEGSDNFVVMRGARVRMLA